MRYVVLELGAPFAGTQFARRTKNYSVFRKKRRSSHKWDPREGGAEPEDDVL